MIHPQRQLGSTDNCEECETSKSNDGEGRKRSGCKKTAGCTWSSCDASICNDPIIANPKRSDGKWISPDLLYWGGCISDQNDGLYGWNGDNPCFTTPSPTSSPTTGAPTAPPTIPAGWPNYYIWGEGIGCPCEHRESEIVTIKNDNTCEYSRCNITSPEQCGTYLDSDDYNPCPVTHPYLRSEPASSSPPVGSHFWCYEGHDGGGGGTGGVCRMSESGAPAPSGMHWGTTQVDCTSPRWPLTLVELTDSSGFAGGAAPSGCFKWGGQKYYNHDMSDEGTCNEEYACACDCHAPKVMTSSGLAIEAGDGCHDILTEAGCIEAYRALFPDEDPDPPFAGHMNNPDIPRGCAWANHGDFGGIHILINYHDSPVSTAYDTYGHQVLCKNHDVDQPDDLQFSIFDPASPWVSYTDIGTCGPRGDDATSTASCNERTIKFTKPLGPTDANGNLVAGRDPHESYTNYLVTNEPDASLTSTRFGIPFTQEECEAHPRYYDTSSWDTTVTGCFENVQASSPNFGKVYYNTNSQLLNCDEGTDADATFSCLRWLHTSTSYVTNKEALVEVPSSEGGGVVKKTTTDGCGYSGWTIYHCRETTMTLSPTAAPTSTPTAAPTDAATASPTSVSPTSAPTNLEVLIVDSGYCSDHVGYRRMMEYERWKCTQWAQETGRNGAENKHATSNVPDGCFVYSGTAYWHELPHRTVPNSYSRPCSSARKCVCVKDDVNVYEELHVNFGKKGDLHVAGWPWHSDRGSPFYSWRDYGWINDCDNTQNGRDRQDDGISSAEDFVDLTLILPDRDDNCASPVQWEASMANGHYSVTVTYVDLRYEVGDDDFWACSVEGVSFATSGGSNHNFQKQTVTHNVEILDGRLTFDAGGGYGEGCSLVNTIVAVPLPDPSPPQGWPEYYTWEDGASCPCTAEVFADAGIGSENGCHDILSEEECRKAYAAVFNASAESLVYYSLHGTDYAYPHGCAYHNDIEGTVLLNYVTPPLERQMHSDYTTLCRNHDYLNSTDGFDPFFDPSSQWVSWQATSDSSPSSCPGGQLSFTSTVECGTWDDAGISKLRQKKVLVFVPDDGVAKAEDDSGCKYTTWTVYYCANIDETAAPTTSPTTSVPTTSPTAPTTTAPTNPTSSPTPSPTKHWVPHKLHRTPGGVPRTCDTACVAEIPGALSGYETQNFEAWPSECSSIS